MQQLRLPSRSSLAAAGFTLIELLIVISIVGVLVRLAMPAYTDYMTRSRRTDAKAMLQQVSFFMERNQAATFRYDRDPSGTAIDSTALSGRGMGRTPASGTAAYLVTFATGYPTTTGYVLLATPQGSQATLDAGCGTLAIDHTGKRGLWVSNAIVSDSTSEQCWLR